MAENGQEDESARPREQLSVSPAVLYPGKFSDEARNNRFKPGHLGVASLRVQANHADFQGRLYSAAVAANNLPLAIAGSGLAVETVRPVNLAKGDAKNLESSVVIPPAGRLSSSVSVRQRLVAPSGIPVVDQTQPVIALRSWQYHLVILSGAPDQLRYLGLLDCVQLPGFDFRPPPPFYHVVAPAVDEPVPLAGDALQWTTIAAVVWSGMDAGRLTASQQQALVDWLHFGGQLIISGPESLDWMRGGFLGPWLPAAADSACRLEEADWEELNRNWSVPPTRRGTRPQPLVIPAGAPMQGIRLRPVGDGAVMAGTGGLIIEGRVGRGRIVVTGFSLHDRRLARWTSLSSLVNGALLRRPRRMFLAPPNGPVSFVWPGTGVRTFDGRFGTSLRFASRDLNPDTPESASLSMETDFASAAVPGLDPDLDLEPEPTDSGFGLLDVSAAEPPARIARRFPHLLDGSKPQPESGLGGWNDRFGVSAAALEAIAESAGLRPPSRTFVIRVLACYLAVLVPLNWLVFWLMGRVEWAWIAAPFIAVAGAVAVVRLAALDIGFVRGQTEIALLEIPCGHSRGHWTGYSALYTSLSTSWSMDFPQGNGFCFPTGLPDREKGLSGTVSLDQALATRMRGFPVQSNSTGLLHAEAIVDLGGKFRMYGGSEEGWELENGTSLALECAGLLWASGDGQTMVAWLGDVAPGSRSPCRFEVADPRALFAPWKHLPEYVSKGDRAALLWSSAAGQASVLPLEAAVEASQLPPDSRDAFRRDLLQRLPSVAPENPAAGPTVDRELFLQVLAGYSRKLPASGTSLGAIFDSLSGTLVLMPGQMILLSATSNVPGAGQVQPVPTRVTSRTLVFARLREAVIPDPQPDVNLLVDVLKEEDAELLLRSGGDEEPDPPPQPDSRPPGSGGSAPQPNGNGP